MLSVYKQIALSSVHGSGYTATLKGQIAWPRARLKQKSNLDKISSKVNVCEILSQNCFCSCCHYYWEMWSGKRTWNLLVVTKFCAQTCYWKFASVICYPPQLLFLNFFMALVTVSIFFLSKKANVTPWIISIYLWWSQSPGCFPRPGKASVKRLKHDYSDGSGTCPASPTAARDWPSTTW